MLGDGRGPALLIPVLTGPGQAWPPRT